MGNYTNLLLTESTLVEDLFSVLSIIGGAVVGLIVLYAVYLFFLMGTASDAEKRRKAKSRVIKAFSSIFIIVILMMMLSVIDVTFNNTSGGGSWGGGASGLQEDAFAGMKVENMVMNVSTDQYTGSIDKNMLFNQPAEGQDQYKHLYSYEGTANISIQDGENSKFIKVIRVVTTNSAMPGHFSSKFWEISGSQLKYQMLYYEALQIAGVDAPTDIRVQAEKFQITFEVEVEVTITDEETKEVTKETKTGNITGGIEITR